MKIGIYGYGNLARGVEQAVLANPDQELAVVFTRRDPAVLRIAAPGAVVASAEDVLSWKDQLDVLVICGGSATDLPEMTPRLARDFNVVDSYDNHSSIPAHYQAVDQAAREAGTVALISCGWDPGLFSLNRLYANAVLPQGSDYTFWGRGVSQGHSDAVPGRPAVYCAGARGGGPGPQRGKSPAHHPAEAPPGVLCSCGRGGRSGGHPAADRHHARLFCRL